MAYLTRRSNGIFYVGFYDQGRKVRQSCHTRIIEEARALLPQIVHDWEVQHPKKLSSLFADFLQRAPLSLSTRTVKMYAHAFGNFLRLVGDKRLSQLHALDAESFRQQRAREVSPVSTNIELRTLRAAFNDAKRLRLIDDNPFTSVKPVREPYHEGSFLTIEEFSRLLQIIDDAAFGDLVKFSVYTMMRRGELVSLTWDNVHLDRREIRIASNGQFRVKGGRPRIIPMNDWVVNLLSARKRIGTYVFTNPRGYPLCAATLSHKFKQYVREAGLDDQLHWHSLRHTGITWLINKGVPAPFVQRIAGHSSPIVTQIYSHSEDRNLHFAISHFN
jgi:integrase